MTRLTMAIRNTLAQDEALRALLGRSQSWDTWIFSEEMIGAKVEGTQRCLIVVAEDSEWSQPNNYSTAEFPRIYVDVWADPTRNDNGTVQKEDARDKIGDVFKLVQRTMHTVDLDNGSGMPIQWGTQAQIASNTGLIIGGSMKLSGTSFSPIRDSQGSWMGRNTYGVNLIS